MERVFVTDFDGTMCGSDFYRLVVDRFGPPHVQHYWNEYVSGRITHFDALRSIFQETAVGEEALKSLLPDMAFDDRAVEAVRKLESGGWRIIVVSAGCHWYIDQLLAEAGLELEVHSNPGGIEDGRLVMRRPESTPFPSHAAGIDKQAIVRLHRDRGCELAFAGDGYTDEEAAMLVPESRRFARANLAEKLRERGAGYIPFNRWAEIADVLCSPTSHSR
jgi:2,3-diketo-5-methylthio-1-phosphopentane phosphatase